MDKKKAALLGAVAGLATIGAAHAATTAPVNPARALSASSYADLLAPVQNATAVMKADDEARARRQARQMPEGEMQLAQYYRDYREGPAYRHHHHHHHAYYRQQHHHHHHSAFIPVPGGVIVR